MSSNWCPSAGRYVGAYPGRELSGDCDIVTALVAARVPKKWVSISSRMAARSPVSSHDPVDELALLTRIATPLADCATAATEAESVMSRVAELVSASQAA
jgi:hypothetical protein